MGNPCKAFFLVAVLLFVLVPCAFAAGENFSIIVLPDTQDYSENHPEIFSAQTSWIAQNKDNLNIVFVSHEGDIVHHGGIEGEWRNADRSMSILDGVVPYGVLPGNHDAAGKNGEDFYNKYFSPERFSRFPWFGGSFPEGTNNNSFQFFSGGGEDFVIVHLDFCPGPDEIAWANSVLKQNSGKRAIVTTHGFLDADGKRNAHGCGRNNGSTEYIWRDLVYPNENVFLVLSGHAYGEAMRTDPNIAGKNVHQILSNYQTWENGGNGFLRILEFAPGEGKIFVRTYSPYVGGFESGAESEFVLSLEWKEGNGVPEDNFALVFSLSTLLAFAAAVVCILAWKKSRKRARGSRSRK